MNRLLRIPYLAYLAIAPALATLAFRFSSNLRVDIQGDGWIMLGFMLGVAIAGIYLLLEASRITMPKSAAGMLGVYAATIGSLSLVFWSRGNVWESFFIFVSIDVLAFLISLLPMAIPIAKQEGQIIKRIIAGALFFAPPIALNFFWLGRLYEFQSVGWLIGGLLLVVAVVRMLGLNKTAKPGLSSDQTTLFIALGTVAWVVGYFATVWQN